MGMRAAGARRNRVLNVPLFSFIKSDSAIFSHTLSQTLQREIYCTIIDGEGGGQPLGERYAASCLVSIAIPWLTLSWKVSGHLSLMIPVEKPSLLGGQSPRKQRQIPAVLYCCVLLAKENRPAFTLFASRNGCQPRLFPGFTVVVGLTTNCASVSW
jgi:hypothetical protein